MSIKERIKKMTILGIKQFSDPYYQGFAAQIAFFIMLSVVPTVVVMTQLLGFLSIDRLDFLNSWIDQYIAPDMGRMIKTMLSSSPSVGNNIILIIMAIWGASRAQFSMMRIANYTYSSGRTTGNFFKERFRSLRTMLMFIITLAFVIVILVYGEYLLTLVFGRIVEGQLITRLWAHFRWPLSALLYFVIVMYNYYVMPIERMSLKELIPGSLFGAAGMLIVTIIYSMYVRFAANYGVIYGSLSSIVALLFWFYFLSWVLVLGILVNKVFRDTRQ